MFIRISAFWFDLPIYRLFDSVLRFKGQDKLCESFLGRVGLSFLNFCDKVQNLMAEGARRADFSFFPHFLQNSFQNRKFYKQTYIFLEWPNRFILCSAAKEYDLALNVYLSSNLHEKQSSIFFPLSWYSVSKINKCSISTAITGENAIVSVKLNMCPNCCYNRI